ncbi:MAG TPA: exodeoxyribonuclease VII small subunit [Bacteroidetes bacterium]|nr:exodeoxyribonuclease VII small subunit [Bacteroidota bacterium]
MTKNLTYKKAFTELQKIVDSLENGELEIDELSKKIKRASELVKFCKEKLRDIESNINAEIEKNTD